VSFRRKLLVLFAVVVFVSVGAVTAVVLVITRSAFERSNEERTAALVAQFRREFNRQAEDIEKRVQVIAGSEALARVALGQSRDNPGTYVDEAATIAANQQLDFLQLLDSDGTIISSAQWPAKFGYKDRRFSPSPSQNAFLQEEDTPDGAALAVEARRQVNAGDTLLYVIGGRRLDKQFLASLEMPSGMRAAVYPNLAPGFSPELLIDPSGSMHTPQQLAALIQDAQQQKHEISKEIHWSSDSADDETMNAVPLAGANQEILAVLLIGNTRRPYVELQRHIASAALIVAGTGIFLAIVFSGWAAAKVTGPVEELAVAARELSAGNWNAEVEVRSSDEFGQLAESFNKMTHELLAQRDRLVQAERVAAWRELARRLAHELKNPLFPLQLTVENLVRARQQSPEQFEVVLRESSATLLAEIANLKAIILRFSDFSKMPQPQLQRITLNDVVQNAVRVFQVQLNSPNHRVECKLELAEPAPIAADPDLLHRALSNLLLNALDAMPEGGTLTLRTRQRGDRACLEVADTGTGLTQEEAARLFTPYYTSKAHGTGLGLAIVQSVISDHGGHITVQSQPGHGTTFVIELPRNLDKLESAQQGHSGASL
jgi:two-component system nitrogen regulation sensor histidine kinase NtrY